MLAAMCFRSVLSSLPLLLFLTVILSGHLAHCMSLEQLCATRCIYGQGGNLCKCNAIHFAGKRSDEGGEGLHDSLAPLDDVKYRPHSQLANGGLGASGSGFRSEGSREGAGEDGRDDVVVEGFFGVEGNEKTAVNKLVSLLKAALDERLINRNRKSRKWQESSFPFAAEGAVY